ncbi:hypothetical protein Dimus_005160 [Dionaea muscipula]
MVACLVAASHGSCMGYWSRKWLTPASRTPCPHPALRCPLLSIISSSREVAASRTCNEMVEASHAWSASDHTATGAAKQVAINYHLAEISRAGGERDQPHTYGQLPSHAASSHLAARRDDGQQREAKGRVRAWDAASGHEQFPRLVAHVGTMASGYQACSHQDHTAKRATRRLAGNLLATYGQSGGRESALAWSAQAYISHQVSVPRGPSPTDEWIQAQ